MFFPTSRSAFSMSSRVGAASLVLFRVFVDFVGGMEQDSPAAGSFLVAAPSEAQRLPTGEALRGREGVGSAEASS